MRKDNKFIWGIVVGLIGFYALVVGLFLNVTECSLVGAALFIKGGNLIYQSLL